VYGSMTWWVDGQVLWRRCQAPIRNSNRSGRPRRLHAQLPTRQLFEVNPFTGLDAQVLQQVAPERDLAFRGDGDGSHEDSPWALAAESCNHHYHQPLHQFTVMLWAPDRLGHRHTAASRKVDNIHRLGWSAALWLVGDRDLALVGRAQFGDAVDGALGAAADRNRLDLFRRQAGDVLADDRFAEDGAGEDVAQRAV
jgi:hypothetical protein